MFQFGNSVGDGPISDRHSGRVAVPTQKDLQRADQRRFDALGVLESNLMAYAFELPAKPPRGTREPQASRMHEILGAYARALREIEVDLHPADSANETLKRVWPQIQSACLTVQTPLFVRDLPESAAFQDFIAKLLKDPTELDRPTATEQHGAWRDQSLRSHSKETASLASREMDLLCAIVDGHISGDGSPFIFVRDSVSSSL